MWLFQYYCYGMRVSDLLLLRWSNIYEAGKRLNYKMYKTKSTMDMVISNELLDILYEYMSKEIRTEIVRKSERKDGEFSFKVDGEIIKVNKKTEWYDLIRYYLYNLSTNPETKNNRIFSDIPIELITDTHIKEIYSKVSTFTSVYNKKLKLLSNEIEECSNIQLNLSSHMARHTFAFIALLSGKDVYYISKALNHKSIKTTEKYINGFPQDELDGKMYDAEISIEDKKAIDDKIKELLASSDYTKKKKIVDMINL